MATIVLGSVVLATAPEVTGQDAPSRKFATALRQAEETGRRLYEQDQLAWKATDILLENVSIDKEPRLRGWIIVQDGTRWVVRFLGDTASGYRGLYDVRFGPSGSGEEPARLITYDPPRELPGKEVAMFRARQSAIAAMPYRCSEKYNAVVLPADPGPGWTVYLLSASTVKGEIHFGGHFRAEVSPDGSDVHEIRALALSCLKGSPSEVARGDDGTIVVVTHLLSSTPNEIHVFLSLLHEIPLFVTTDVGVWIVKGGHVEFGMPFEAERGVGAKDGGRAPGGESAR